MENEVKEVLEEGLNTETGNVNRKSPKVMILGIVAVTTALLLKFRNKISAKIENIMVNKLDKKGYFIQKPAQLTDDVEQVFEEIKN